VNTEQGALAVVALVTLAAAGHSLWQAGRPRSPSPLWLWRWLAAWLLVGLLRHVLAAPSFVHANLHGSQLVGAIFEFPTPAAHRASYGQFSFLALGALCRVLGQRIEVLFACQQVISWLTLAGLGWLSVRWTGRSRTAWLVLALGALHPGLLRLAASEDAHVLATALGVAALVALDRWAQERRPADWLAGTGCLILAVHTRQTLYLWPLLAWGLVWARWQPQSARNHDHWWAWLGCALSCGVVAARVWSSVQDHSEQTTLIALPMMLQSPELLWAMLRRHPLLDLSRFAPPLTIGCVLAVMRVRWRPSDGHRWPTWLAVALLAYGLLTLPFAFALPGVELSFRLPVLTLAVLAAATAWDERLPQLPTGRAWLGGLLLAVGGLLPLAWPSWQVVRQTSTDLAEYRFIRDNLDHLPAEFELLAPPDRDPLPAWTPPLHLFRQAGQRVQVVSLKRLTQRPEPHLPLVWIDGVACVGRSVLEIGPRTPDQLRDVGVAELARFMLPFVEGDAMAPKGAEVRRPWCAALAERSQTLARSEPLPVVGDAPFVTYPGAPFAAYLRLLP
jgi:hypothetical protein